MERVSAQQLAEWAAEARERWSVPGLAVGLLQDREIVSVGDGVLELGRPDRVSRDTIFRIASITKPFTATLAMTLAQEGLLALDKPPPKSATRACAAPAADCFPRSATYCALPSITSAAPARSRPRRLARCSGRSAPAPASATASDGSCGRRLPARRSGIPARCSATSHFYGSSRASVSPLRHFPTPAAATRRSGT